MTSQLAPLEAYRLWSETWESDPSAIVALEARSTAPWLGDLRGRQLCDIACGTGRWMLHAQAQGASVFGTDFCREMLLQARKKPSLAGKLVLAHSAALPFASECADAALCALSLGHIPEAAKAIAELARILRKGGRLIVTDFHPDALLHGWKRTFRSGGQSFEIETYPYTKESLIDHARRSGLVLEDLLEPCFDEPEREIFLRAGKPELFEQTRGIPAVLIARWRRP